VPVSRTFIQRRFALLLLLGLGLFAAWYYSATPNAHKCPTIDEEFKELWRNAPSQDSGEARYTWAVKLVDCGYFLGLHKNVILKDFGPSDRDLIAGHWSYVLGFEHGSYIGIDNDWASLKFKDDIVVSASIHSD
jgi:hypothetical protein